MTRDEILAAKARAEVANRASRQFTGRRIRSDTVALADALLRVLALADQYAAYADQAGICEQDDPWVLVSPGIAHAIRAAVGGEA